MQIRLRWIEPKGLLSKPVGKPLHQIFRFPTSNQSSMRIFGNTQYPISYPQSLWCACIGQKAIWNHRNREVVSPMRDSDLSSFYFGPNLVAKQMLIVVFVVLSCWLLSASDIWRKRRRAVATFSPWWDQLLAEMDVRDQAPFRPFEAEYKGLCLISLFNNHQ